MTYELREFKLEVTHRCSLNCVHCSSDSTPSVTSEMEVDDCRRLLQEAAALGARKVAFSGGEPLLYKDLARRVSDARSLNMAVVVYTSGNAPDCTAKLGELAAAGVSKFVFSIFGSSAKVHERITRVLGSYDKTCSAISNAVARGANAECHFVPIAANYAELEPVIRLVTGLGVRMVSVLRFVPQGRGALLRQQQLTRLQHLDLATVIRKLRNAGMSIRTGSPFNFLFLNDPPECKSGIDRIVIGPDLRGSPCDAFKQVKSEELTGDQTMPSLAGIGLRDYWVGSPYLNAVRHYLGTPFGVPCRPCKSLTRCKSGCLAQKVIWNGDLRKAPDPDCIVSSS